MKFRWMMWLVAAGVASAASTKSQVVVCMDPRNDLDNIMEARNLASRMFGEVGIRIRWQGWNCSAESIQIQFSGSTPETTLPGALAYALPRQGTHIVIFYDRVKRTVQASRRRYLLAHVIVHEVTHILQGIDRHSESGLMKAHWDDRDFNQMEGKGLSYGPNDVSLLRAGLERRTLKLVGARN